MKRIDFDKKYKDSFFTKIARNDFTLNGDITEFFYWCYEHDFFDNLTLEDINWFMEVEGINLPLLKAHGITIGIDIWDNAMCRIGIDPSPAFNKTSQCSILMQLPITSKREKKEFYSLLDLLLSKNMKNERVREWYKDAASMFYGEYFSNM